MGVTRFPNGLSNAGTVIAHGLTSVTGVGTITTPLDTIVGVNVSVAGTLGTATTDVSLVSGTAHANTAGAATFIARTYQAGATAAGTVAKDVAWTAFGTKA